MFLFFFKNNSMNTLKLCNTSIHCKYYLNISKNNYRNIFRMLSSSERYRSKPIRNNIYSKQLQNSINTVPYDEQYESRDNESTNNKLKNN